MSVLRLSTRRGAAWSGALCLCLAAAVIHAPTASASAGARTEVPGPVPGYDYSHAIVPLAGCETNELPGNDDQVFPDPVPLGFSVNFYGNAFDTTFVNNNGNITFDQPSGTYVPFPLEDASQATIIAPFFTDVDTRGPGRTVHYGSGTTASGQKYFCVDSIEVAQYDQNDSEGLDDFQLVLYDASGAPGGHDGDFDIEFNYDHMPWDHDGQARAGFAAGTGQAGTSLELPGGGVAGAMIDGGPNALVSGSANSATPGRYHFQVRGNGIVNTGSFTGTVTDQDGLAVSGARVQACRTTNNYCRTTVTGQDGTYIVNNLGAGDYALSVSPPDGSGNPAHGAGTLASNTDSQTVDLQLTQPRTTPPGTTIGDTNGTTTVDGVEVAIIYWGTTHPLTFTGCAGATSAQVRYDGYYADGSPYTSTVDAVEVTGSPGTYTATIPRFDTLGVHGDMTIHELLDCAGSGPSDVSFTIYIDPSGTVVDQNGDPVAGATVTLLSAELVDGTYTPVPDGSTVLSPSNRDNPDLTDAAGMYGWDVTAGFYKVEATKQGCNTVDSDALSIPPAVTGLVLTLDCEGTPTNGPPVVDAGPDVSGPVDTPITLHPSVSDPDGDTVTSAYTISSTDCTLDQGGSPVQVTCSAAGRYVATLTASDGINPPVSDTTTVTVTDVTPPGGTCFGLAATSGSTRSTDPATGVATIRGTSGDDVIIGTPGQDRIVAGGGNDVVCAGGGNDSVSGGAGNDRINGGGGNDAISAGSGDDYVRGGSGNDLVRGGSGDDQIYGQGGADDLRGDGGADRVNGGGGDDRVTGGADTDACNGGAGTDVARTCESQLGFP